VLLTSVSIISTFEAPEMARTRYDFKSFPISVPAVLLTGALNLKDMGVI
jgi:hypothetical protein